MKRIFLFVFFVLLINTLKSQQFKAEDYRHELSIKLDVIDEKRIERGVKMLNDAFVEEREILNSFESMDDTIKLQASSSLYKKMIKRLTDVSEKYREGNMIIYTVFQENCAKFQEEMKKMNHYAEGLNKAKFYERKASKAYDRSLGIRDMLSTMEKYELIQYRMAEALELEKLSIRDRGRAVQIYQDFPIEYNYGWIDDVTPEQVAAAFNDPAISRPPDDLFVQKSVDEIKVNPEKPLIEAIVFRVQIAAHTISMDDEYIRTNIYFGRLPIREIKEDGWYKYSIGEFDNFNDAKKLLDESKVHKAFIVAYQGNKKLTIKDALSNIKENQ